MSASSVEPDIYALAEKVRAKFAGHMGAKDHNLRMLIAHARLYDDLDNHVEELRAKRKKTSVERVRPAIDANRNADSVINPQDPPKYEEYGLPPTSNRDLTSKPGMAAECAIVEDDSEDSIPQATHHETIVGVDPEELNHRGHPSPTITEEPEFEMISTLNRTTHAPKPIVSEISIEDSSDSESDTDSDTDSNSDIDPADLDMAAGQEKQWATPITISRPQSPRRRTRWEDEADAPSKPSGVTRDILKDEPMPALERSPARPSLKREHISESAEDTGTLPLKASPLLPQLSNKVSNISTGAEHDHRLHQALQHLLETCDKKPSQRNAILRWLRSFAYWSPSDEGQEMEDVIREEKVF